MKLPVKLIDIIIIIIALCLIILSSYSAYIKPQNITQVLIQGQDSQWIFNIDTEEVVAVAGPIGETVVRISGERAWVESSPCDNQNCAATGFIKRQGQWAACLPNSVFVVIQGKEALRRSEEIDAVSW